MCVDLCDSGDTKISFACMNGNVAEKTVDSTILRNRNLKHYWRTENFEAAVALHRTALAAHAVATAAAAAHATAESGGYGLSTVNPCRSPRC